MFDTVGRGYESGLFGFFDVLADGLDVDRVGFTLDFRFEAHPDFPSPGRLLLQDHA